MRPHALAVALGCALALPAGPSRSQDAAPRAATGYGGGFVEFLMTGQERPTRGWSAAPRQEERRRLAALPDPFEVDTVRREPVSDFRRQTVAYGGPEAPGTIVVDTPSRHLYLVGVGGSAIRYGIGVGRPGFEWAGIKTVTQKRQWPGWTPPPQMLARRPDLPRHMEGGPGNPLGARALYLGSSLYRIHGTNEPHTIGRNVSSGCIRMMNEDVIHLYDHVRVGTKVKVI